MIQLSKGGASGGGERQLQLRLEAQRHAGTPFAAHQALLDMMKDVVQRLRPNGKANGGSAATRDACRGR